MSFYSSPVRMTRILAYITLPIFFVQTFSISAVFAVDDATGTTISTSTGDTPSTASQISGDVDPIMDPQSSTSFS